MPETETGTTPEAGADEFDTFFEGLTGETPKEPEELEDEPQELEPDPPEEGEPAPAPEPVPDPVEVEEQRRKSLLGRIQANDRGRDKMTREYETRYGRVPDARSPEEIELEQQRKDAVERVQTEVPDIVTMVEAKVHEAVEDLGFQLGQLSEAQQTYIDGTVFEQSLDTAHPDWRDFLPDGAERKALDEWVGEHDYTIGKEIEQILESGSANEVIEMLDAYTEDLSEAAESGTTGKSTSRASSAAADAAMAVPGSSGGNPLEDQEFSEDDFEGTFDAVAKAVDYQLRK